MSQRLISIASLSVLLLFLFFPLTESKAQSTSNNFLTYTNTQYGFTLKYPNDWRLDDTNIARGIIFSAPDNGGHVMVSRTSGWSNMSLEEMAKRLESAPSSNVSRLMEVNKDGYFLSGHPAIRWISLTDVEGGGTFLGIPKEVKAMAYVTKVGNDLFSVEYDSSQERFAEFLGTAQTIIDSVQIIGKG